jgi:phytoene dehydrogenase-like protein
MASYSYDAVVVGSGPNGLAAAITIARHGLRVVVMESQDSIGGGARTEALTIPGFRHDVCSAVHPLGIGSPFFCSLPLERHGLHWIHPPAPLAHPLENDDGETVLLKRSVAETADLLGEDGTAYRDLMGPLAENAHQTFADLLGPPRWPRHFLSTLKFAWRARCSARGLAESNFRQQRAQALIAGLAAHSVLPLEQSPSAAIALMLAIAGHAVGWPIPKGGAGRLSNALADHLRELGGQLVTGLRVTSLEQLPSSRVVLFDVGPHQLASIAGDRLPVNYRRQLTRYRYGPAAFKIDWALGAPIPWKDSRCAQAATVHLGGSLSEIAASEKEVWNGRHPTRPFVLVTQPSLFDDERAPPGQHTAWAYCHVPSRSTVDMTHAIEAQMERFAPGFRSTILTKSVRTPSDFERHNANLVGGDINGGVADWRQILARPVARLNPYRTPIPGVYLCSASTPPGGGVHGMCGYHAAKSALKDVFGIRDDLLSRACEDDSGRHIAVAPAR